MSHLERAPRSSCAMIPIGVLAAIVTMGCASQPPPSPPPTSVARAAPERYGATMMQPSDEPAGQARAVAGGAIERAPVTEAELSGLDDAHLADVVQQITDDSIRIAQIGERRATDRRVWRFARDMATRRLDAQNKLRARLSQLGIEAASGPVSALVRADATADFISLHESRGRAFDRVYLDEQLRDLTEATALVGRIAGHVANRELREALEGLRAKLEVDVRLTRSVREDYLRNLR